MISACLLGMRCRYDGGHSLCSDLLAFVPSVNFVPFCPEQLGGLSTPRPAADIIGGDGYDVLSGKAMLVNAAGDNVTFAFKNGAEEALKLARLTRSFLSIMKDKSPSCGLQTPYCDKQSGFGIGVTAALFESSGIRIFELGSNDTFPDQDFLNLMETHGIKPQLRKI
ncbi:MAG: DUF523 domain-containing protein [Thermodesulfobacteriota bacterium]|nr:DUF523 domain-containing protein [Thermodesulfobacteriota bacterium]